MGTYRRGWLLTTLVVACQAHPGPPAEEGPKARGVGAIAPPAAAEAPILVPSAMGPAALALDYEPAGTGDEERIAAALAAVRQAPSAARYAELANAFLERRRKTGDDRFFLFAESALTAGSELAPDDPLVARARALSQLDQHRFEEARDTAQRAVESDPTAATAHLLLGDALLELGRYEAAIDAYQAAVDRLPDLRSYSRGAYMRWLYGDVDGAMSLMAMAARSGGPRDPGAVAWCLVELGTMHWHRGDGERAAALSERALELVPSYPPALHLRARARLQLGDAPGSIADYEALVAARPSPGPLLELVETLQASGRSHEAAERLAQAETLGRDDPAALARYYARHGLQPERALQLAESNLRAHATISAYDAVSLALWRNGRLDEASAAGDRALALGTPDANLYLHRALIALAAGEVERARELLTDALSLNPSADPQLVSELRRALAEEEPT